VQVIESVQGAQKKPVEYYVNLSLAHLHAGNIRSAERVALEGVERYGRDRDLLGNLTIAYQLQAKWPEAAQTAKERLALGRDLLALEVAGALMARIGDEQIDRNWPAATDYLRQGVKLCREALAINPRWAPARHNLAQALISLERYDEAFKELAVMSESPLHRSLREAVAVLMAKCLDRVAAHKECVETCDRWLEEFPGNVHLKRIRSETIVDGFCIGREVGSERVVEPTSLEFFERIVLDEENRRASDFAYLARLREWMGDVALAMRLLEDGRGLWPDYWEFPFDTGTFLWRLKDFESGLVQAQEAARLAPMRSQPWTLKEMLCRACGHDAEAEAAKRRAEEVTHERRRLASLAV
jgi:tetratricopeptide (TPR) repeat protein